MKSLLLTYESFRFAWQALRANLLRTTLSLLGVTVGIFAIIAILTIVDALQANISNSLNFLGNKVIYVQKWPWGFGGPYPWWKYFNRPSPTVAEFKFLERYLETKKAVVIIDDQGNVTIKNGSNSMSGAQVTGVSFDYSEVSDFDIVDGRYFSPSETEAAREVVIIGEELARTLFPNGDPVGQSVKLRGIRFQVIGTLKKQGEGLLSFNTSADRTAYIPYATFSKMFQGNHPDPTILVKGLDSDPGLAQLEGEITGLMRSRRSIKPLEDSDFALNRPEAAAEAFGKIFVVLNIAGGIIAGFSLLVGGFGIANIMFVSVKERTNIIGIQKSLGAKNSFILLQFLFESVFLSLIGGVVGLVLVYLITFLPLGSLEAVLSLRNVVVGLGISTVIGVLSGIVPAALAARLDPVIAIRQ